MTEYNEVMMTEVDQYLFGQGKHYEIYRRLGAHLTMKDGTPGVYFAVWAPNARYISVVGNFNHWNRDSHPMKKTGDMGIWEVFIPNLTEGEVYKYCVNNYHGVDVLKGSAKAGKGAYKILKWTSSNTNYATVNSKGLVKTKQAGKGKTVTITASSLDGSNKKAVKKIKIK